MSIGILPLSLRPACWPCSDEPRQVVAPRASWRGSRRHPARAGRTPRPFAHLDPQPEKAIELFNSFH